jgi:hypothetical protein
MRIRVIDMTAGRSEYSRKYGADGQCICKKPPDGKPSVEDVVSRYERDPMYSKAIACDTNPEWAEGFALAFEALGWCGTAVDVCNALDDTRYEMPHGVIQRYLARIARGLKDMPGYTMSRKHHGPRRDGVWVYKLSLQTS